MDNSLDPDFSCCSNLVLPFVNNETTGKYSFVSVVANTALPVSAWAIINP